MTFQFTAQEVTSWNPLQWVWKEGELVGLIVSCEVNYGTMGLSHQIDVWNTLTPAQQEGAKAVYEFLGAKVKSIVVG